MARTRLTRWAWGVLARFCYRRWASPEAAKPAGIPGNRDPANPCTSYAPRRWKLGDWNDCQTDGHALCAECCHRAPVHYDDLPLAPGAAGMFSHQRPTGVAEIDQWFYEFIHEHILRHPRPDWPIADFEAARHFFGGWKAAFVRWGIDRPRADKASVAMLSQPALPIGDHLNALIHQSGRYDPNVLSIQLWGPQLGPPPKFNQDGETKYR